MDNFPDARMPWCWNGLTSTEMNFLKTGTLRWMHRILKKYDLWYKMHAIKEYKLTGGFNIWIKFDDGFESIVNIKPLLGKGITAELLSQVSFDKINIDSGGGLVWENGFDICPNYLREMAEEKSLVR